MNTSLANSRKFIRKDITVSSIYKPVFKVNPDTPIDALYYRLLHTGVEIALIADKKKDYGYWAFDDNRVGDELKDYTAGETFVPIPKDMVISDNLSLYKLLKLFKQKNPFYYVKTGERITHWVTRDDLDSFPVKAGLFMLSLELEDNIKKILKSYSNSQLGEAFSRLTPNRLKHINDLYWLSVARKKSGEIGNQEKKFFFQFNDSIIHNDISEPEYFELVNFTNFLDKKRLINSFPDLISLFSFENRKQFNDFFENLYDMRNAIAHGDSIFGLFNKENYFPNRTLQQIRLDPFLPFHTRIDFFLLLDDSVSKTSEKLMQKN